MKEFTREFSETELREAFRDHGCDDPRFSYETKAEQQSPPQPADSSRPLVEGTQILRDLCGLKGAVLASIESLSPTEPSAEELAQIKAELDRVRSLLWLHLNSSNN